MTLPALQGQGFPAGLWELLVPHLESALRALDLGPRFGTVLVAADDLPGDDEAWYRLLPGRGQGAAPVLAISCHVDAFCRRRPLQATEFPPRAVWEQFDAPGPGEPAEAAEFAATRAEAFLHHHLLTVRDLVAGELAGADLPPRQAEAFAATWAVTVDGRLARARLPGYTMSERRARFSRLFSAAGIILPEHWQVFESLWDGALASRRDVLGVARRLPRL